MHNLCIEYITYFIYCSYVFNTNELWYKYTHVNIDFFFFHFVSFALFVRLLSLHKLNFEDNIHQIMLNRCASSKLFASVWYSQYMNYIFFSVANIKKWRKKILLWTEYNNETQHSNEITIFVVSWAAFRWIIRQMKEKYLQRQQIASEHIF